MDRIIIFDTTLRDGEQAAGASLNVQQKVEIAKQLESLNVDVIEAGFPVASKGDFESVRKIAKEIKKPIICALSRALRKDIEIAAEALKPAKKYRIHTFLATSDIHMKYKLRMSKDEVLKAAKDAVKYARKFTEDVEFSPEDATRSDFDFLSKVVEEVIKNGATTVNIPDTVGYALPYEFGELIKKLTNTVPNIDKVTLSVHCHDDLGLAVANSISGIINGARQVECTVNGIGERAGNAALEEIVMTIYSRRKILNTYTNINTKEISKTSKLVSSLTGFLIPPNKAIVGANAFAHAAGIHQHGVLAKRLTYEIINPKNIGLVSTKLVLSKHSGRHALQKRLKDLGYTLRNSDLRKIFIKFKKIADKKKCVFDDDLVTLIDENLRKVSEVFSLQYFHISSGSNTIPTATVKLKITRDNKIMYLQEAGYGDGPVDAAYNAIDKITKIKPKLIDYTLRSISSGKDALGEVNIKIVFKGKTYFGRGASTDILEASIKSYLDGLNKIEAERRKKID